MASVGNKIIAWVASPYAGGALGQSANYSITVVNLTAFEIKVPIYVAHPASQSNPPEVYFYASNDGGTSYDTLAYTSFAFSRNAGGTDKRTFTLPGGAWAVKVITGGIPHTNYSLTIALQTLEVVTAYYGS